MSLRNGRASYLHDHDLLVFFPDGDSVPTPFACGGCIYPMMALRELQDAFEIKILLITRAVHSSDLS